MSRFLYNLLQNEKEYETMKKKILSLTLAAVMVLGLAACGGGGESSSPEQSDPGTSGNVSTSGGR